MGATALQNSLKIMKTETNSEMLNRLYKDFGLTQEDVHVQMNKKTNKPMFKIITRSGIEKIQARLDIDIKYELLKSDVMAVEKSGDRVSYDTFVIIKATGVLGDKTVETYGECTPNNSRQGYPVAIAEKRAMSRVVLKLAGLYSEQFYGEDEAEDFRNIVRESRNRAQSQTGSGSIRV